MITAKDPNLKTIDDVINDVLLRWSPQFIQALRQNADVIPKATGKGAGSFDYEVRKASGSEVAAALFAFESHLRLADMKKFKWSSLPPLENIKEWIRSKGVSKFRNNYNGKKKLPVSDTKLVNQIAWGIRTNKLKTGKRKRFRWYAKKKEDHINQMYVDMLDKVAQLQIQDLKKSVI